MVGLFSDLFWVAFNVLSKKSSRNSFLINKFYSKTSWDPTKSAPRCRSSSRRRRPTRAKPRSRRCSHPSASRRVNLKINQFEICSYDQWVLHSILAVNLNVATHISNRGTLGDSAWTLRREPATSTWPCSPSTPSRTSYAGSGSASRATSTRRSGRRSRTFWRSTSSRRRPTSATSSWSWYAIQCCRDIHILKKFHNSVLT